MELLTQAVDLYRGELLPGFYQDWVQKEQRRLVDLYFRAVRRLIGHLTQAEDREHAIEYARRAPSPVDAARGSWVAFGA
jgi:two-component SAPR family response regulator